jgi:hypothetical protein
LGKAFGGVLNPHCNTFNIITHNFLTEILFFFKFLAANYCDIDKESNQNLAEEKFLLVIKITVCSSAFGASDALGKFTPLHAMKAICESGGIAPIILNLFTS